MVLNSSKKKKKTPLLNRKLKEHSAKNEVKLKKKNELNHSLSSTQRYLIFTNNPYRENYSGGLLLCQNVQINPQPSIKKN